MAGFQLDSTLCLKKLPTFELSLTLLNLNRSSKFFHCWKAYEICYKNSHDITHLTFGMLLHYLGILKIQIFCRYSADIVEMQTYCILIASNFDVHPQLLILHKNKNLGTNLGPDFVPNFRCGLWGGRVAYNA